MAQDIIRKLELERDAWRRAAQVITPGGSEFFDPEGVHQFNANFKQEYVNTKLSLFKARKELAALKSECDCICNPQVRAIREEEAKEEAFNNGPFGAGA